MSGFVIALLFLFGGGLFLMALAQTVAELKYKQTGDNMTAWTIEPTKEQWKAFFEAVGRFVADPLFVSEVEGAGGPLAWSQDAEMGLDLADLFSRCYSNPKVAEAVLKIDKVRKAQGIKSPEPWRAPS